MTIIYKKTKIKGGINDQSLKLEGILASQAGRMAELVEVEELVLDLEEAEGGADQGEEEGGGEGGKVEEGK